MAVGNKYQLHVLSRSQYESVSKSSDYLYFVCELDGKINLYKGDGLVSSSLMIVSSLPSSGVLGKLYLSTSDKKIYYYSGTAWVSVTNEVITSGLGSSSTNDTIPSSKLVWDTMNSLISEVSAGIGGAVHSPVQAINDLKALTDMSDKMICLVEDRGSLYRYDAESSSSADNDGVIAPSSGGGRWIKVRGSIGIDTSYLEWNNGNLTLKSSWVSALSSNKVGNTTPLALGTANAGTSSEAARVDHVHPTTGLALEDDVKWRTY